ncbi:pilus assembly protein [Caulobacter segnis]|uniref:TadE/TadG family type IV pilus assembly protein n=1 Tax=Caulobacter segnis TaxID=88688 RepID=UPI00240F4E07|nr:TadE/TadG family type IV pilus assembly protein [Caulobacter segnis]MDG2520735.1 pilus assembly protein [Caulobacter segnis]
MSSAGLDDEEGSAAVEFALIAPFLLLILLGIMVASIYLATLLAVSNTAIEAARATIPGMTTAERSNLATARANAIFTAYSPFLDVSKVTVAPADNGANTFRVQVSYNLSDFGFTGLIARMGLPTQVARTVVVANGGF